MKVHWTPEAKVQLKQIEAYIAQDSPRAARQAVTRLVQRCGQLVELSHSGRRVPEFNRDELRELLYDLTGLPIFRASGYEGIFSVKLLVFIQHGTAS